MTNLSRLGPISATSPTLAEVMRSCFLRAGISRAPGVAGYILGNPKAWIGTAYHYVLEKIRDVDSTSDSFLDAVERLWAEGIEIEYRRTSVHALDRRFGRPETWPGYNLAKASVRIRARELVYAIEDPEGLRAGAALRNLPRREMRERQLTAFDGKLVGKPDVISGHEIIDYKTGAVTEFDETVQADILKPAYARQLRVYGYLVEQVFGWWPVRGRVMPFAGPSVEVLLDPSACVKEALEAVRLLERYNTVIFRGNGAVDLAAPAPAVCKWCPYKTLCPAFWGEVSPDWSGQLDGAAIEGTVREVPRLIYSGAAFALSIDIKSGTEAPSRAEIVPLSPETHAVVTSLKVGDRIRLVGAWARPGRTLVPTSRSIIVRADDVPHFD